MYVPPKCEALTFASSNRAGKFYHAPDATLDSGVRSRRLARGGTPLRDVPRIELPDDGSPEYDLPRWKTLVMT